jgi:hypothetical protein
MSFITESKKAYRQVEALERENSDHEISMARSELASTADKATAISDMLQGKSDTGNPLEAWVQSKITKAKDYITSVHDYLKYTPGMNESFELEENTFEKIYQMQQDGKSTEDIAKELKLNPALVKKVLGENTIISEGLSDAQISQLKKEYEPLKGKTITTSQYQQLKNILFKLQDGDLEKLQKQNIPFASTGAGSILRVRKSPVKITSVKVPGLEGMAEEPKNPYAIGMAAAMKATGDTPPLKKSTITKAHKIADKVKEEEVSKEKETEFHKKLDTLVHKTFGKRKDEKMPIKESHFDVNTQVLYKGQKAQIIQLKEPQIGNYYIVKLDSGENVEANHNELKLVENKINEGARALVEAISALQKKADKTGMPYSILKQVYDRGMAAWKGGHRPGAGQHQWAFARVNSFVTKSSGTWGGADSDLAKKVKGKE